MRPLAIGIAVLAVLCACSSVNAGDLTRAEESARDFSVQNLRLGATFQDFKRRFPSARLMESDKSSGTSTHIFKGQGNRFVSVEFFRGRVYRIGLVFSQDELSRIGGKWVLYKKLKGTFGIPDDIVGDVCHWVFPRVNRWVSYVVLVKDGTASVLVTDIAIDEQVDAVKANNLDLGF